MRASHLLAAVAIVSHPGLGLADGEPTVLPVAARAFPGTAQPVLANLCGRCHSRPDHPSGFKLTRVVEGYAGPTDTARNLRAAAAFVRAEDPAASPLLAKGLTPHGGAKDAPLPGRTHPAYRTLEAWVFAALPPPPRPAGFGSPAVPIFAPTPLAAPAPSPVVAAGFSELPPPPAATPAKPADAKPNPDDPFDPAAFNR